MKLTLIDYNQENKWSELSYYNKELDNFLRDLTQTEFGNISKYLRKNTELSIGLGTKQYLTSYSIYLLTYNKENKSVFVLDKEFQPKIKKVINYILTTKDLIE